MQSHPWQLPTAHSFTFTSAVAYNCASTSAASLGPRPKTNPSTDRFQYCMRYTGSDIRTGWGLGMRLIHRIFWSHHHIWSIALLLSGKGHTHYTDTSDIDAYKPCMCPALECSQIQKLMWLCIHAQHVFICTHFNLTWKKNKQFLKPLWIGGCLTSCVTSLISDTIFLFQLAQALSHNVLHFLVVSATEQSLILHWTITWTCTQLLSFIKGGAHACFVGVSISKAFV